MKKLRNFLIFFVFSCILSLFVYDIAKADTTIQTQTYPIIETYLSHNPGKTTQDFVDLVMSKMPIPDDFDDYDNYVVMLSYSNNTQQCGFYFYLSNNYNFAMNSYNSLVLRYGSTPINKLYNLTSAGLKFNSTYTDMEWTKEVSWNSYTTNWSSALFLGEPLTFMFVSSNLTEIQYTNPTNKTANFVIGNTTYAFNSYIPLNKLSSYNYEIRDYLGNPEPEYTYTSTILENGNVQLNFSFNNYTENNGYAFEIENIVSNEEYGIANVYNSIFPNMIPFGSSYSIELSYDTSLYITLAKYTQVEQTSLYYKEEIYTHVIDVNNVVFENTQDPYFKLQRQTENLIEGVFENTTNSNTCWYRFSDSQNEDILDCNEIAGFSVHDNGYVEVIIKKGSTTIYSRKINYLGSIQNDPYIIYNIEKRDFYSIINWNIQNEIPNITFRYSTNNGNNFTSWVNYSNNSDNYISVFNNSTTIIEIANSDQSSIYDSKAIIVINDISNIKDFNNTTINFVDKFKSIFSVNTKILQNVNSYYEVLRSSKMYLIIFIPFLSSLICAIIYLIRRK